MADQLEIVSNSNNSSEATGSAYMGTLDYVFSGGNLGILSVSLTNTTDAGVGGFLTGFVFNIDSLDAGASASLLSTSDPDFLDTGIESAGSFGMFDGGAALGANFNGGGAPSAGLAMGSTGTFEFSITASDADLLSASSFLSSDSDFYVRFRGLTDGNSDMVGVPAPGSSLLALVGISCMTRRRR